MIKLSRDIPIGYDNLTIGDVLFVKDNDDTVMILKTEYPNFLRKKGWVYKCSYQSGKVLFTKGKEKIIFKI